MFLYLLVSLGGHGQVQPVENIVDLLALHLGVNTVGEEPVAGLRDTHRETRITPGHEGKIQTQVTKTHL